MGGKSKKVTIGYKYYAGLHAAVCYGPVDSVNEIDFGKRNAWTGSQTTNGTISIDKPELFGGERHEGGIVGDVDVLLGDPSQGQNSYLAAQQGALIPNYRHLVSLVFKKCYLTAMTDRVKPLAVTVTNTTKVAPGWKAGEADISNACNPAHIIYAALTNDFWGLGLPASEIDTDSFSDASEQFYNENFGLAFAISSETQAEEFLHHVLGHCNAVLYTDIRTGKYKLKPLRSESEKIYLDESNVVELVSFQRPGYSEIVNEVKVVYRPIGTINDSSITVQNLGAIMATGNVVSQTVHYPGITNAANAARVGQRDLKQAVPFATVELKINRRGWDLAVGDVFELAWTQLGISEMDFRILSIDYGTIEDSIITVHGAEDVFGMDATTYIAEQTTGWVEPEETAEAADNTMLQEATYWDLVQNISQDVIDALTASDAFVHYAVERPDIQHTSVDMISRPEGGVYSFAGNGLFAPWGFLDADISATDESITLTDFNRLDFVAVGTYAYIDNEAVIVNSINSETGVVSIGRGTMDTSPMPHLEDASVVFMDGHSIVDEDIYQNTEVVQAKALTRTFTDVLHQNFANEDEITVTARWQRPWVPAGFKVNTTYYLENDDKDDLVLVWTHRDRLQQTASLVDYKYASVGPEASVTYTVTIYDEDGTTQLRQSTGISGLTYTYTAANRLSDVSHVSYGQALVTYSSNPEDNTRPPSTTRLTVKAVRSGTDSEQSIDHTIITSGWGMAYGNYYGG